MPAETKKVDCPRTQRLFAAVRERLFTSGVSYRSLIATLQRDYDTSVAFSTLAHWLGPKSSGQASSEAVLAILDWLKDTEPTERDPAT